MRLFFAIFFLLNAFIEASSNNNKNENYSLIHLESPSTAVIDGCVNAITGEFFQASTDIHIGGSEPLVLERYLAHNLDFTYGAHSWNSFGFNISSKLNLGYNQALRNGNGGIIYLDKGKKSGKDRERFQIQTNYAKIGVTNFSGETVGRKNHLRHLIVDTSNKNRNATITFPNGTVREYALLGIKGLDKDRLFPTKEILPSGAIQRFSYNGEYGISNVTLSAKNGDQLGAIDFVYPAPKDLSAHPYFEVKASNGQWARYHLHDPKKGSSLSIKRVEKSFAPSEEISFFKAEKGGIQRILVSKPDSRAREAVFYHYGRQRNHKGSKEIKKGRDQGEELLVGRVNRLTAPVDNDHNLVNSYQFDYWTIQEYHINTGELKIIGGHTTVYDALGHKSCYHFNRSFQLDKIEKYCGSSVGCYWLYTTEHFRYDAEGQLTLRYFDQCNTGVLFCRQFVYNSQGDAVEERLWGNITGKNLHKTVELANGEPCHNGIDVYTKKYRHSDDKFHNLVYECDGFQETHYEYLPDSDTLKAKFAGTPGKIELREFYCYNPRGELLEIISDDGETRDPSNLLGVTCRKIERREYNGRYITKKEELFFDLESGCELLHSRVEIKNNATGKPLEESFYDANGDYLYTITKEYDSHDNLIAATDPSGVTTFYRYDANDNLIEEERESIKKRNHYDFSNRLIKEEIYGDDSHQVVSVRYNRLHQKIGEIDSWGREVRYEYDYFGRPIKECRPSYLGPNQTVITPVIHKEYDPLGNVTKLTTPTGYEIHSVYNIRGDLIQSSDQDGMLERCEYTLNGLLARKIQRSGLETRYHYDFIGRVLEENLFDGEGNFVRGTRCRYKGALKIEEVDTAGLVTTYSHNAKGQCIAKKVGENTTYYTYDAQGRIAFEYQGDSVKAYQYDHFNRIIQETTDGRIARKVFDAHGRVIEEQAGDSILRTEYNANSQPTKTIDPEGRVTVITYHDTVLNPLGQLVRVVKKTDPNGTQTEVEMNTFGEVARQTTWSPYGEKIQEVHHYYDLNQKLSESITTVFSDSKITHEQILVFEYDFQGRLIALREGVGSPEEKSTGYAYNLLGQKIAEYCPNGITLQYTYDAMGRMASLCSSDRSTHYEYVYNRLDNLVRVDNLVSGTSTTKEYDHLGQLVREKLENGLVVSYVYDTFGRISRMIYPDGSAIDYTYQGTLLHTIKRNELTHTYLERNGIGKPILEQLMNGKSRRTSYALDGTKTEIHVGDDNPSFEDVVLERDLVGRIRLRKRQGKDLNYAWDDLHQLSQENSTTYQHDSLYNRTQKGESHYLINQLNQIVHDGTRSYYYDLNGNLIQAGENTYSYDALNRLVAISTPQGTTRYTYDHENRRMSKCATDSSEAPMLFFYFGMNELGSCKGGDWVVRVLGENEGGERGASLLIENGEGSWIPLTDLTGNISQIEDTTGSVCESYTFDLFGIESEKTDTPLSPWRYSGKRIDEESGLVYFGHRYYDPTLGRWITADPKGYSAGPNLYAYVNNSPIAHLDQYGLTAEREGKVSFSRPERGRAKNVRFGRNRTTLGMIQGAIKPPDPKILEEENSSEKGPKVCNGKIHVSHRDLLYHITGKSHVLKDFIIVFLNGIMNTLEDAIESANLISEQFGGCYVYLLKNETGGLSVDLIGVGAQMAKVYTSTCVDVEAGIREIMEQHPDKNVLVLCHSKGALIFDRVIDRLPVDYLKRMCVFTFGGAHIIKPRRGLMAVMNYVSSRDIVPLSCNFLTILSHVCIKKKEYLKILDGRGYYGLDHAFASPTYQNVVSDIANKYLNE